MVDLATAPTDTSSRHCRDCGRAPSPDLLFLPDRPLCYPCKAQRMRGYDRRTPPTTAQQLRDSWLARAVACRQRAVYAADVLTARALYDQAADWEALAAREVGG